MSVQEEPVETIFVEYCDEQGNRRFALTLPDMERLKVWAGLSPEEFVLKLKSQMQTEEGQQAIQQALAPLMAEFERVMIETFEASDGADAKKLAEKVLDGIRPKLRSFEDRLCRLEAELFRRGR